MGFGKGSSSSAPVVTEEQKELLTAQTGFLTETALPQYVKTIGGAEQRLNEAQPFVNEAALDVFKRSGETARGATSAAGAQAQVQANRMGAARTALESGQSLGTLGMNAGQQQITSAGAPMDLYSKYASVVYGTPQASTTPSFQGTQGQRTGSKGFGF
jgi:hypothetical protein